MSSCAGRQGKGLFGSVTIVLRIFHSQAQTQTHHIFTARLWWYCL